MLIGAIIFAVILFSYLIIRGKKRVKDDSINLLYRIYSVVYTGKTLGMLKAHNILRESLGLKPFKTDRGATERAKNRVKELIAEYIKTGKISHLGFADDAGILLNLGAEHAGENIAFGYATVAGAFRAFVNSPGHYHNIIKTKFDFIGIAFGVHNGRLFWVVFFGGDDEM